MLPTILHLLLSCDPQGGTGPGTTSVPDPDLVTARAVVDEDLPTVVSVRWRSTITGEAWVEYTMNGVAGATPIVATEGVEQNVVVLGLKAGADVTLQGVVVDEAGNEERTQVQEVALDVQPADLPTFTVTNDSEGLLPGYILVSILEQGQGWVIILDADADPVWFTKVDEGLMAVSPAPSLDGKSIIYDQYDLMERTDISGITRVRLDGTAKVFTRAPAAHHDFDELPGGQYVSLSVSFQDALVDGEIDYVAGDGLQLLTEGSTSDDVEPFFDFFEEMEVEAVCSHYDSNTYANNSRDWTHGNSIVAAADGQSYFLLSKNLDGLFQIDATTGEILDVIGGPYSTLIRVGEGDGWSHGHLSQVWEDGFVVFDNGYHHDVVASQASEYKIDWDAGTYERVWNYEHPFGAFIHMVGDVRKLPDDSYLVSWTTIGTISRIAADGTLLWQAGSELGAATGRVTFIEDLYTLDRD